MATLEDLREAKALLSSRWLRRTRRSGGAVRRPAASIRAAISSAGHGVHAVAADGAAPVIFASLHSFVTLSFSSINRVDAAVGQLKPGVAFAAEIPGVGALTGHLQAHLGRAVCKVGRSTRRTEGRIMSVFHDSLVTYQVNGDDRVAQFDDQLRIEPLATGAPFSKSGDSGALVVDVGDPAQPRAVGLLFAAAPDGTYSLANPIGEVFSRLRVEVA